MKLENSEISRQDSITKISKLDRSIIFESEKLYNVAHRILSLSDRKAIVIDKNNFLRGIITTTDLLEKFLSGVSFEEQVGNVMSTNIVTCKHTDTIEDVLDKMKMSGKGTIPIISRKILVGYVSEKDFVKLFHKIKFNKQVHEKMTKKPLTVKSTYTVRDVIKTILKTKYRRFPVTENKKFLGLITANDLLKHIYNRKFSKESLDWTISEIMQKNPHNVKHDVDISEAIKIMTEVGVDGLIVRQNENLNGIITERNILEEIY